LTPNSRVWSLAGPILITNISVPLLGIVDTAVLGHLEDSSQLAAVAIGSVVLTFLLWAFGFLRMGTTGFTANALGAGDRNAISRALNQGVSLALVIGFVIQASHLLWLNPTILLMGAADLAPISEQYIQIRLISAYPAMIGYVISGWLIGLGNARWPLVIALTINCINIFGDILFVVHFDMGAAGAAWASVIAEYCGLAIGTLAVFKVAQKNSYKINLKPELTGWSNYLKANSFLFFRTLTLLSCIAFFTAQGARLGALTVAANAILYQLVNATAYSLDAFAHATESLAGQFKGAKDRISFVLHTKAALMWSVGFASACSLLLLLFGSEILSLFSSNPQLLSLANEHLLWVAALPVLSVLSYQLDGLFIGTNNLKEMRDIMVLSAIAYLVIFYFSQGWGNHGLWLAFCTLNLCRSIGMSAAWLRVRKGWFTPE